MSRILACLILILPASLSGQNSELLVAAASDLARLQVQLSKRFEQASGQKVKFVSGSSGMLARQIRTGAPYDVYLSANERYVSELAAEGQLVTDSIRVYALGRIALWSAGGRVKSLADLLRPFVVRVSIANPAHAPYGEAARQAFTHLNIWRSVEPKIVMGENVRQALQYAESGNTDAAITAWSLVFDRGGILLPAEFHSPIRQAGGVVKSSSNASAARKFLDFLTGETGGKLLQDNGLFPP